MNEMDLYKNEHGIIILSLGINGIYINNNIMYCVIISNK